MFSCIVVGVKNGVRHQYAFTFRNFTDQIGELTALAAALKITKDQYTQYVEYATQGYSQVTINHEVVYETTKPVE